MLTATVSAGSCVALMLRSTPRVWSRGPQTICGWEPRPAEFRAESAAEEVCEQLGSARARKDGERVDEFVRVGQRAMRPVTWQLGAHGQSLACASDRVTAACSLRQVGRENRSDGRGNDTRCIRRTTRKGGSETCQRGDRGGESRETRRSRWAAVGVCHAPIRLALGQH